MDQFSYEMNADGSLKTEAGAGDAAIISKMHHEHAEAWLMVTGHQSAAVVPDSARRKRFVQACLDECDRHHYDGADLDFESLRVQDKDDFTALCRELARALHAKKKKLSITVIPKTQAVIPWDAGTAEDWPELGKVADRFKLMTYRAPGFTQAGPVSPRPWIESCVHYAERVGVAKSKIQIGVPFYAIDYPRGKASTWLPVGTARALARGRTVHFDKTEAESHFDYRDGSGVTHTVWFHDAQAIEAKCALAAKLGVRGVCCWSIGQEDPETWTALEKAKRSAPAPQPAPTPAPAPAPRPAPKPPAPTLSFAHDVLPIIRGNCTACHFAGGQHPLDSLGEILQLVVPGKPGSSLLVAKTQPGGSMSVHLSASEASTLEKWVQEGAKP